MSVQFIAQLQQYIGNAAQGWTKLNEKRLLLQIFKDCFLDQFFCKNRAIYCATETLLYELVTLIRRTSAHRNCSPEAPRLTEIASQKQTSQKSNPVVQMKNSVDVFLFSKRSSGPERFPIVFLNTIFENLHLPTVVFLAPAVCLTQGFKGVLMYSCCLIQV